MDMYVQDKNFKKGTLNLVTELTEVPDSGTLNQPAFSLWKQI